MYVYRAVFWHQFYMEVFYYPSALHAHYMVQPAHFSLIQQTVHVENLRSLQEVRACGFIRPRDDHDTVEVAHVEVDTFVFLLPTQSFRLASVQKSAYITSPLDLDFYVWSASVDLKKNSILSGDWIHFSVVNLIKCILYTGFVVRTAAYLEHALLRTNH